MAIDDPIDAFKQQYMKEKPALPMQLAKFVAEQSTKLGFPEGSFVVDILVKAILSVFDDNSAGERVAALFDLLNQELRHLETTKASQADVQKAIQLAFWYDRRERDDNKRERYIKLIGNALRSEEQVQDVTSFIQILEQLNERDIAVLKVLNNVMNREGDWRPPSSPIDVSKVHPNTFTDRSHELAVQVAMVLGQKTETNLFSREEGYGACNRLQGFGLAHHLESQTREIPITNYCFRPSVQGLTLLSLLGEKVANLKFYLQAK